MWTKGIIVFSLFLVAVSAAPNVSIKRMSISRHCVSNVLGVKYDGSGNIYVGGANTRHRVDRNIRACRGSTQGWRKIVSFNPSGVEKFVVETETITAGHEDCGGTAYWDAHKSGQQFFQKCSWSGKSVQKPRIKVTLTLYKMNVRRTARGSKSHLLGQWYLLGASPRYAKSRSCLVDTIFTHNGAYYLKEARNIGSQRYRVRDNKMTSIATRNRVFRLADGRRFRYEIAQYRIENRKYEVMLLTNIRRKSEQYLFGEELYTSAHAQKLWKIFPTLKSIRTRCYRD